MNDEDEVEVEVDEDGSGAGSMLERPLFSVYERKIGTNGGATTDSSTEEKERKEREKKTEDLAAVGKGGERETERERGKK